MDVDTFHALALRVIAREASETDRTALEAELASTPARRDKFEQLRIAHDILRTAMPIVQATRTYAPELPAHRVGELRTAVRQHFGPAAERPKAKAGSGLWAHVLRWVFGGGGLAALGFAIAMFCFANRTIEVGLYKTDLERGGDQGLTAQDVPTAKLLAFDQDAPFDAWQDEPLAWNERAKIWVDNEHDLLHITYRVRHGQVVTETQPLAPSDAAQREQIKQVVAGLGN
jgi:hypothetical protein